MLLHSLADRDPSPVEAGPTPTSVQRVRLQCHGSIECGLRQSAHSYVQKLQQQACPPRIYFSEHHLRQLSKKSAETLHNSPKPATWNRSSERVWSRKGIRNACLPSFAISHLRSLIGALQHYPLHFVSPETHGISFSVSKRGTILSIAETVRQQKPRNHTTTVIREPSTILRAHRLRMPKSILRITKRENRG